MTATVTYTAGIFIRRRFRKFLEREKFKDSGFSWIEQKGLIDSIFIVKGEEKSVIRLFDLVKGLAKQL